MRSDLTANFLAKLSQQGRWPVQLMEIRFASGTRYVSDIAVGVADGLANNYEALVLEWGSLKDAVDAAAAIRGGTLDSRQLSVTLWNGGSNPIATAFASENPENVKVYLYQWFSGLAESDKALIDIMLIQDPISYTEASGQITLDLVSLHMGADPLLGAILDKASFPNAEEYGFGVPVLFGQASGVKTFLVDKGLMGTLADAIDQDDTSIVINELVSDWPSSGTMQINYEKISYTSRTGSTFSGCTRGASSTFAAGHPAGREVFLVGDYYEFAACEGAVTSIDKVYRDGSEITTGFTKLASSNPARVRFTDSFPYLKTIGGSVRRELALTSVDDFLNTSGGADPTVATLADRGTTYVLCALGDWQQVSFNNSLLTSLGNLRKVRVKVDMAPTGDDVEYYISFGMAEGNWICRAHDTIPQTSEIVTIVADLELTDPSEWGQFLTQQVRCRWWPIHGYSGTRVYWIRFEFEYDEFVKEYSTGITLDLTNTSGGIKPDVAISNLLTNKLGLGSYIDAASFSTAQAKLDTWSYRFNGLLPGDMTSMDALRKMLFESRTRLVANGGKLKLLVKEIASSKSAAGTITKDQLRLRSIEVTRQPLADVINKINCKYAMTYSGAADGEYAGLAVRQNSGSQTAFGVQETEMPLDLITSSSVAQNLADYYLSEWAYPASFISYQVYMDGFAYEKEDKLVLATDWMNFYCVPGILLTASREFGSGKTGKINHFTFTALSRPAPVITASLADTATATDSFTDVGMQADIEDAAAVTDTVISGQETTDQDGYGQGGYGQGGYGA